MVRTGRWSLVVALGSACSGADGSKEADGAEGISAGTEKSTSASGAASTTDAAATAGVGTAGAEPGPCGHYTAGPAFTACAATYLAGSGADAAGGVAIGPDGSVWWTGSIVGTDFGLATTELLGGGDGAVVRLTSSGRELVALTRIGQFVADVVPLANGALAVTGDFGLAVLEPDGSELRWHAALEGAGRRLASDSAGRIAVLAQRRISLFAPSGDNLGNIDVAATAVTDLALGENGTVYATGFKQDDSYTCSQLQLPYIRAYSFTGQLRWAAYDWTKEQAGDGWIRSHRHP